jgi:hypothetical protein
LACTGWSTVENGDGESCGAVCGRAEVLAEKDGFSATFCSGRVEVEDEFDSRVESFVYADLIANLALNEQDFSLDALEQWNTYLQGTSSLC